ncbi:S8 family serine peptidase [Pilimelia anulata]|uniref:S8 family serine peptidase n=1 Tax=Pilimelia anulata TaxID=53371 RepID=UPI0016672D69|nr:S8 family serine peptidase [Pilimelia anulata]
MINRTKRAGLAAVAAGLVASGLTGVAPAAALAAPASPAGSHWASWLGATDKSPATTLKQVRTLIGADTGTAAALTGKGVGVALIDTGVAPVAGLPAAKVVNGPDLSFESQSADLRYLDSYGHGTHMAGIIVGNDTATGTVGLAPDVKLTSIKVGTANGTVDVSQVIAAVDWVVQHRNDDPANPIKVINLSYGSGGTVEEWNDSLGFAAEKAWQSGIVVVAAAGNDGNSFGSLANPASDEWILSVGAADTKGTTTVSDDVLTTFTNQPRGGKQLNILAPGASILSLRDPLSYIDGTYPAARSGETLFKGSGTSQAAAVVSAAVALIRQSKPSATPDQIKSWITQSATYVPNGIAATMGLKEVNVNAALARSTTAVTPQNFSRSNGTGSLDNARGSSRVMYDNVALAGDRSVWGPLKTATWAPKAAAGTAWSGGTWMGYRVAGDGWTGTSWASRTWAPATWTSKPWSGAATWTDPAWEGRSWTGRSWTGRSWTGGTWTGRSWSSDDWS